MDHFAKENYSQLPFYRMGTGEMFTFRTTLEPSTKKTVKTFGLHCSILNFETRKTTKSSYHTILKKQKKKLQYLNLKTGTSVTQLILAHMFQNIRKKLQSILNLMVQVHYLNRHAQTPSKRTDTSEHAYRLRHKQPILHKTGSNLSSKKNSNITT